MNVALGLGLRDASTLLGTLGLLGVLAAVVIETGLLVGFFLPGDSLLFTAGVFAARAHPFAPLWLLLLTVPAAVIVGDQLGFLIGRRAGDAVFHRSAKRIGPKQLEQSRRFFDRYGSRTILLARFVPVARTIAPVMAGAAGMPYRTFAVNNVIGGIAWGVGVPVLGYLLGGIALVRGHIEVILLAVVLVSILPLVIDGLRATGPPYEPDSTSTAAGAPGR